jgi:hypothetical protein
MAQKNIFVKTLIWETDTVEKIVSLIVTSTVDQENHDRQCQVKL